MGLILLAVLYGFCDQFIGAKKPAFGGKKALTLAAIVVGSYLLGSPTTAALALVFFANRVLDSNFGGGDFTPTTTKEKAGLLIRYATTVPAGALAAYVTHGDVLKAALAMGVWSVLAVVISSYYGKAEADAKAKGEGIDPQLNTWIEAARGAAFGALASLV